MRSLEIAAQSGTFAAALKSSALTARFIAIQRRYSTPTRVRILFLEHLEYLVGVVESLIHARSLPSSPRRSPSRRNCDYVVDRQLIVDTQARPRWFEPDATHEGLDPTALDGSLHDFPTSAFDVRPIRAAD